MRRSCHVICQHAYQYNNWKADCWLLLMLQSLLAPHAKEKDHVENLHMSAAHNPRRGFFYCTCHRLSTKSLRSSSKVLIFLGNEDISAGPHNLKGLFKG